MKLNIILCYVLNVIVVLFKAPLSSTLIPHIFHTLNMNMCVYMYLIDSEKVIGL